MHPGVARPDGEQTKHKESRSEGMKAQATSFVLLMFSSDTYPTTSSCLLSFRNGSTGVGAILSTSKDSEKISFE